MTKTTNFNFNQWEPTDPIRREDFNADNAAIDAALGALNTAVEACGNCKLVVGTYTGTGVYGSSNPISLTFKEEPLLLLINGGGYTAYMTRSGRSYASNSSGDSIRAMTDTWGKTVSWYNTGNADLQMNRNGTTYTYLAFFA